MKNSTKLHAYKARKHAITGIYNAASGHPGGSLSIADILSVLYFEKMNIDPENPYADGRWRFCLHDLDFSLENQWGDVGMRNANAYLSLNGQLAPLSEYTNFNTSYMTGNNFVDYYLGTAPRDNHLIPKVDTCLISSPMHNSAFRTLFTNRAKVVNEIYSDAYAQDILLDMQNEVSTVMQRHLYRWGRDDYNYSTWKSYVNQTRTVLDSRPYLVDMHNNYNGQKLFTNGDFFLYQVRDALRRFMNAN